MVAEPPAGYLEVGAGRCSAVTLASHEADARALLADGTLYEAAARDLAARPLQGRGVAYAIALPVSHRRVVVRRNRHGGAFARLTRDLFLPPTRAPRELQLGLRLAAAGVRIPELVMYGIQRVFGLLRRSDVVTAEVDGGRDLSTYLSADVPPAQRAAAWEATRRLVASLDAAGARHHDLNVKNVLLAPSPSGLEAWVLDVDRVVFGEPDAGEVRRGNAARLLRSARKWRAEHGALFDERDVPWLVAAAG